jgi:hypothetical protein
MRVPELKFEPKFVLPSAEDTLRNLEAADKGLDEFLTGLRTGRFGSSLMKRAGFDRSMDHRQFVLNALHHSTAAPVLVAAMIVNHGEIADTYAPVLFEMAVAIKLYRRSPEGMHSALLEVLAAFEIKVLASQSETELGSDSIELNACTVKSAGVLTFVY